ncbi:hypothetical protein HDU82_001881, partial [Entophlyctis luteolus]
FILIPPATTKPLKRNAVLTLLADSPLRNHPSVYTLCAIIQAFIHLHYNATRLPQTADIEFVVMATTVTPNKTRKSLLELGARLLIVPPVRPGPKGSQFEFVYTKLQAWNLEGVFDKILFLDLDLFLLGPSPVELNHGSRETNIVQRLLDHVQMQNDSVICGVRDCCIRPEEVNVGLMVFVPSQYHFKRMLEVIETPPYNKHFEQSLVTEYYRHLGFVNGHDGIVWMEDKYNVQTAISPYTNDTTGFHYKFWSSEWFKNEELFSLWRPIMRGLRRLQLKKLQAASIIAPVFPDNFADWSRIRNSGFMYDSFAVYGLYSAYVSPTQEANRQLFADTYEQADYFSQTSKSTGLRAAFAEIRDLLDSVYNWVWMLAPGVHPSIGLLVHSMIGEVHKDFPGKSVVLFTEAIGNHSNEVAAVLFRREFSEYLKLFDQNSMRSGQLNETQIWNDFVAFCRLIDQCSLFQHGKNKEYYWTLHDWRNMVMPAAVQ